MDLFTIGYEKAALADVLASLKSAGVAVLIDVRERPQSRRAGFSKTMLAASAAAEGIDYVHLKPLGTPPEGRLAHRTGDHPRFWAIVEAQLTTPEAQAALEHAAALARQRTACLLCYEGDWRHCHRKSVAERLAAEGFVIHHLMPHPAFL